MIPPEPLRVRLGVAIQRRRRVAGWSQEAFADRVGVHRTFMSTVERGLSNLSLDNLERIARTLGVAPGLLLLEADGLTDDVGDTGQRTASDATPAPGTASGPAHAEATHPQSGDAGGLSASRDTTGARPAKSRDSRHRA